MKTLAECKQNIFRQSLFFFSLFYETLNRNASFSFSFGLFVFFFRQFLSHLAQFSMLSVLQVKAFSDCLASYSTSFLVCACLLHWFGQIRESCSLSSPVGDDYYVVKRILNTPRRERLSASSHH
jgi:hypothetical protein